MQSQSCRQWWLITTITKHESSHCAIDNIPQHLYAWYPWLMPVLCLVCELREKLIYFQGVKQQRRGEIHCQFTWIDGTKPRVQQQKLSLMVASRPTFWSMHALACIPWTALLSRTCTGPADGVVKSAGCLFFSNIFVWSHFYVAWSLIVESRDSYDNFPSMCKAWRIVNCK